MEIVPQLEGNWIPQQEPLAMTLIFQLTFSADDVTDSQTSYGKLKRRGMQPDVNVAKPG